MPIRSARGWLVLAVAGSLLVLAACEHAVVADARAQRSAAGVPALVPSTELDHTAGASAARMCAAGAATPEADVGTLDPDGLARAVRELASSAVLDAGIADPAVRTSTAVDAAWAEVADDPTVVDPRWEHIGVGQSECPDGRVYLSVVFRDAVPGMLPDSRTSLFMGQELGAVGGFPGDHDQGYVDYVGRPAGVTTYTDLRLADYLTTRYDLGSGDICSQCYVDNPTFDGTLLAVGLHMVGDLPNIVSGARDANIATLGNWIKASGRPVFLRIGYEFDGSWNSYDPAQYKAAFQRIVTRLRDQGVTNLVTVWQSSGTTRNVSTLMRWYPGDAYVDWVGYSYFNQTYNPGDGILDVARQRHKPAMVAEATPKRNLSLGNEDAHWNAWFQTFFDRMEADRDVIKAVAYINTRWFDQPMWDAGWGDSRVQIRPTIKSRWIQRLQHPMWAPGDFRNADRTYTLTPNDLTPP